MKNELLLRDVVSDDLPIVFEQQLNQEANSNCASFSTPPGSRQPLYRMVRLTVLRHCISLTFIQPK